MNKQVLIVCDDINDAPIRRVVDLLGRRRVSVQWISIAQIAAAGMSVSVTAGGRVDASLGTLNLTERSTRIWYRRPSPATPESFSDGDAGVREFKSNQYHYATRALLEVAHRHGSWMNDPHAERAIDQNKILQQELAASCGIDVAPLICTDQPEKAVAFAADFDHVAIKPVGAFVAEYADGEHGGRPITMFTRRLTQGEFQANAYRLRFAPAYIQPYLPKLFELRVTVVGHRVLAARIDSQSSRKTEVDWRNYDFGNTEYSPFRLDDEFERKIVDFVHKMGLVFAALDFVVGVDGGITFLDANPAGQYGWIEDLTGLPISEAISEWLAAF